MKSKKILILYASAGSGHKKAAEAVLHALSRQDIDVEIADIVDHMPAWMGTCYRDGYIFLITRLAWFWGVLYFLTDTPWLAAINVHLRRFLNAAGCRKLVAFLLEKKPDVVVSTQFLASEIVSYAKEKVGLATRLITVVTDFGVHNFWVSAETDIYCCASPATREVLLKKGIPGEKIKVTGIPLDEKFAKEWEREALMIEFGLRRDLFTVLVATGGIGAGPIEEIADALKDDAQLLVVCGTNADLYARLVQRRYPNVRIFGFVDYMQKLMAMSDCMVTKAGGLSVTEGLSMGLPMVFFFLIPGQEANNARVIKSEGAGLIAEDPQAIREAVLKFRNDPEYLSACKKQALKLSKPDSCRDIIALI